ncbi:hypothetical protein NY2A_b391L [Paramecium bursaria Chlorella virus NY2A]|uniref:Uncharacterized protein b391L n=1 Tax=Paramecium bursaria Chlorella virus NY2A TaxID=46021 RepID=A7IWR6_PBCVN|nr:hypothetical protein NY2A_b391L [Paramecium bursaria Chlorella virus NY2A]ABT14790.1 hypothetical protein NY2A_b391L [Paramecium bursaria Chlorella virus NY2A]
MRDPIRHTTRTILCRMHRLRIFVWRFEVSHIHYLVYNVDEFFVEFPVSSHLHTDIRMFGESICKNTRNCPSIV